jgi:hypothetical protein
MPFSHPVINAVIKACFVKPVKGQQMQSLSLRKLLLFYTGVRTSFSSPSLRTPIPGQGIPNTSFIPKTSLMEDRYQEQDLFELQVPLNSLKGLG